MQDLLAAFGSLFTFLITQLGTIASFFTTNLLGQILLGIALFMLVFNVIMTIINKIH